MAMLCKEMEMKFHFATLRLIPVRIENSHK
jgi:hypothetical protein